MQKKSTKKTAKPQNYTSNKKGSDMTLIQAAFTPDLTQLNSGYGAAKARLADLLSNLHFNLQPIPSNQTSSPARVTTTTCVSDWVIDSNELTALLDHIKSYSLLAKANPPLIEIENKNGREYVNMDNLIVSIILDSIVGEGNYKLNYLQNLRHNPTFINDNWYRVIDRLQWLLFDRLG